MPDGTVNSQIVDSVASVVTLTGGSAPSQAFAMLDTVMIETLGMAMYNAVSRQQGASMLGSAAVTAACAKMLGTPFTTVEPLPPAPKPDPIPTGVQPLEPTPKSPAQIIAEASADAADALARMQGEEAAAEANAAAVQAALKQLATQAAPPPAPTPTPPPTSAAAASLYTGPTPAPVATGVAPPPGGPAETATATTTAMTITSQTVPVDPRDRSTEPPVPGPLR
jgi:hypothetical protein